MTGRIEKLRSKRDTLNAQIRAHEQRDRAKERKADTRRKILAGAAVLAHAEHDPEYRATLWALLGGFINRDSDRALFDLPPLAGQSPGHG
jgi:hypothetical protein